MPVQLLAGTLADCLPALLLQLLDNTLRRAPDVGADDAELLLQEARNQELDRAVVWLQRLLSLLLLRLLRRRLLLLLLLLRSRRLLAQRRSRRPRRLRGALRLLRLLACLRLIRH